MMIMQVQTKLKVRSQALDPFPKPTRPNLSFHPLNLFYIIPMFWKHFNPTLST